MTEYTIHTQKGDFRVKADVVDWIESGIGFYEVPDKDTPWDRVQIAFFHTDAISYMEQVGKVELING